MKETKNFLLKKIPSYEDGAAWSNADAELKKFFLKTGEAVLGRVCEKPFSEQLFSEYFRTGVRAGYEKEYFSRRYEFLYAVLAECLERRGRFFNDILRALAYFCEEPSWCLPAHLSGGADPARPEIDLFAAETAAMLALALYILGEELEKRAPQAVNTVRREIETRVKTPYLQRTDMWWLGNSRRPVNNWSSWISANMLIVFLFGEPDAHKRRTAVQKACATLQKFCDAQPNDGECPEGVAYWNVSAAAVFNAMEMLAMAGEPFQFCDAEKLRRMEGYPLSMYIGGGSFVCFGDSAKRPVLDGATCLRFARWAEDDASALMAAQTKADGSAYTLAVKGTSELLFFRAVTALFTCDQARAGTPLKERAGFYYYAGSGLLSARSRGGGMLLAAKGGACGGSHDHCDAGAFIVVKNNLPVVIDVGRGTYTAQYFSPQRWELWFIRSAYHNIPVLNGQEEDCRGKAVASGCKEEGELLIYELDMSGAYPQEAMCESFVREIRFDRKAERIEVYDSVTFRSEENRAEWPLLCAFPPRAENGRICIGDCFLQTEASQQYRAQCERTELSDPVQQGEWGREIYRLRLYFERIGKNLSVKLIFQ